MTLRALITSLLGCAMLLGGCGTTNYTYSIAVRNESTRPVVVGLAKEGPPYQDNWATPEQIATFPSRPDEHAWGIPLAPGKTAEVKQERAKLDRYGAAYVRVYAGDPALSSLLSISSGSPNRLDIPLKPGENNIVVSHDGGKLTYKRLEP